jgi:hypothetical protein
MTQATKPTVTLIGTDGNVFALMGRCTQALKRARQYDAAKELVEKVTQCESYDQALSLMMDYCEVE